VQGSTTVREHLDNSAAFILGEMFRRPGEILVRRWNWKAAVTSSLVRAAIFFAVNLTAGTEAAIAAFVTELVFRICTSGFYGAIAQQLSRIRPSWKSMLYAVLVLPIANHTLEFLAHWYRGTPELTLSILASVTFTALSSSFHVFVMRRGLLVVGDASRPLSEDLSKMPRAVASFAAAPFIWLWRRSRQRRLW
jgi:hypothetical protein